jgi:hypothetical protein
MFDFPNSPTTGQQVTTPNGGIYQWDGTKWASVGFGPAFNNVGRNFIHNSLFSVAQRGAGPITIGGYTMDRWTHAINTDTVSVTNTPLTDADRTAIGDEAARLCWQNVFTGNAAAGAYNVVQQRIEDVYRLAGKTVTISFWAKAASGAPKVGVSIDLAMGTGGSPSADVYGNGVAITIGTTWTRYSTSLTFATMTGKTIGTNGNNAAILGLWFSCGTTNAVRAGSIGVQSGTIQLWGIQLEIGSVTTPLEKPDPQQDLAKCQRFYQIGYYSMSAYGAPGWGYGTQVPFAVSMRATPTMFMGTPAYTNASTAAISASSSGFYNPSFQSTATGNWVGSFTWTASADL